jgi:hypothetical protein
MLKMKITKSQLKQIIKEEIDEGLLDTLKGKLGLGKKSASEPAIPPERLLAKIIEWDTLISKMSGALDGALPAATKARVIGRGLEKLGNELNAVRRELEG